MDADIQPFLIKSVAKQAVCWLLLVVYGFFGVSVPYPAAEEKYGEVIFRAEAAAEEEGSFLRICLSSEQPVDSFVLHFFLDPAQAAFAGEPIVENDLRTESSYTHTYTENDHSVIVAYCSAAGFQTDSPILTLPVQAAKGAADISPAALYMGDDSSLTVYVPEERKQQMYSIRLDTPGVFLVDPVSTLGMKAEHGVPALAWQLRNGVQDVTGNGEGDENDITVGLMQVLGLIPDVERIKPLLQLPLMGEKHIDKFRYTGTLQERDAYKSDMVSCELTTHSEKKLTYYILDIYIRDIRCLRTAIARESFGRAEQILITAKRNNAIYAINGDCYFARKIGVVMQNGTLLRDKVDKKREIAVLFEDGTLQIIPPDKIDLDWLQENGAYHIWSFGPSLLTSEGGAITKNSGFSDKKLCKPNPRTAIGYAEPGHYYFVVVDGRFVGGSLGMEMNDLSILMHSLGCKVAYNLDGGGTTSMVSAKYGNISKSAAKARSCSDIVYIVDDGI